MESRGVSISKDLVKRLIVPITSGSIFELLLGCDIYWGACPAEPKYSSLFDNLKIGVPSEILLCPFYLNDRLVAILYGDGGDSGTIRGHTGEYQELRQKVSLTMSLILLKAKVRSPSNA